MLLCNNGRGYTTFKEAKMAGKGDRMTVSDTLRLAIRACPGSLQEKSRRSGIDAAVLCRFVNGKTLLLETVDRLAAWLGLGLLPTRKPPTPGTPRKTGRPRKAR